MYGVGGAADTDVLACDDGITAARKTRRKYQIGLVEPGILPLRAEVGRVDLGTTVHRTDGVREDVYFLQLKARPIKRQRDRTAFHINRNSLADRKSVV